MLRVLLVSVMTVHLYGSILLPAPADPVPAASQPVVGNELLQTVNDTWEAFFQDSQKQLKDLQNVVDFFFTRIAEIVKQAPKERLPQGILFFDDKGKMLNFRTVEEVIKVALLAPDANKNLAEENEAKIKGLEENVRVLEEKYAALEKSSKEEAESMLNRTTVLGGELWEAQSKVAVLEAKALDPVEVQNTIARLKDRVKFGQKTLRASANLNRELADTVENLLENEKGANAMERGPLLKELAKRSMDLTLALNTAEAWGYAPLLDSKADLEELDQPPKNECLVGCSDVLEENFLMRKKVKSLMQEKDECLKNLEKKESIDVAEVKGDEKKDDTESLLADIILKSLTAEEDKSAEKKA